MTDLNNQMPDPAIFDAYRSCRLCPRKCGADRLAGRTGFCGETASLRLGRAALHVWEEPCLAGEHGAGAVFFAGCSLRCVYCQNGKLSRGEEGVAVTPPQTESRGKDISVENCVRDAERLADIFLSLAAQGAACIDLVTPDHFLPHVIYAVKKARLSGLSLPVVCNCSGYADENIRRMPEGIFDIYLTDFKYLDSGLAKDLSSAPDYPEKASAALREMVRQQPELIFEGSLLKKGVIVRHLILPGHVHASMDILTYLHEQFGDRILLSLMNQFTPEGSAEGHPELSRTLTRREYRRVLEHAISLGITNAYMQEGGTASESFIPSFDGTGVL